MANLQTHNRNGPIPSAARRRPPEIGLSTIPGLDPGMRRVIHGPIQSMDEDREQTFWQWLFHRG